MVIISSPTAKYIKGFLYEKISLYELDTDIYQSALSPYILRTIDTHSAIEVLISRLTILDNWNASAYGIYNVTTVNEIKSYDRLFYFVTQNCNRQLVTVFENTCAFIKSYASNFFRENSFTMQLFNWITYGISIVALLVLIPFPYRAYRNVVSIILLFFDISKEEKRKKIEDYEIMRKKLITHFSKIKKIYRKTNFIISKPFAGKNNLDNGNNLNDTGKRRDSIISYIQNNEEVPLKDSLQSNTEKGPAEAIQLLESNKKVQAIMNRKKNFVLIIFRLLLVAVFFTAYAIAQFFIYSSFFDKLHFTLNFLIHLQSSCPYLSSVFNGYRREVIEAGLMDDTSFGIA